MLSSNPAYAGPVIFTVAVVVILLLCRWVFKPSHTVSRSPERSDDYGLLVPITTVRTVDDAQMLRGLLRDAGIRGTITEDDAGFAVLVFQEDAAQARELVRA